MNALSDTQLLRAYAERRSEAAFAELVRRHIDFVHSAAFRMVNDSHLAEDVTQGVFVALAKDAGKLSDHPVLSGWLHRTARNIAAQSIRTEVRRRHREQQAAAMNEFPETDAAWEEIAPHLDVALAELSEHDRDAVLLRYFENKPAQEMAAVLGISAEAAQKRVSRAVEKLHENFAKRGITAGAAGLASVISANAVQAAPAGLAVTVSATALAGAAVSMTIPGKALVAAAITLLAGAWIYQFTRPADSPAGMAMPQPPPAKAQNPRRAQGDSLIENMARTRSEKPPVDRIKELERLKQRWLELKPRGNAGVPEQETLAKESAKLLLSGTEAVELLRFLKKNEFWGESTLEREIAGVFGTSQADEARAMLLEIADTKTWSDLRGYKTGGDSYRETWSKAAGKSCPDEEFDSFCRALNSPSCAQEALFGRNERLFETDPVAALASTLEALEDNVPSDSRTSSLLHLFEQDLPSGVNFENLEKLLPLGNRQAEKESWQHAGDPVSGGREKLFEKWAKVDSVAAADYVMANPDRCSPHLIVIIAKAAGPGDDDWAAGLKWVERFPEGSYFDSAAGVIAPQLGSYRPIEARQLASRISDPELRKECLDGIETAQAIKRGEIEYDDGH